VPGETALAFFTAYNPTDEPIVGISTYNVVPYDVREEKGLGVGNQHAARPWHRHPTASAPLRSQCGVYFNKIQCFCFEEQRLNPHEEVDMPVFFYIDPEFAEDPNMLKVPHAHARLCALPLAATHTRALMLANQVNDITLSYTFFQARNATELQSAA
jgi:cytochrome c oxidase assembly protein subunit 11